MNSTKKSTFPLEEVINSASQVNDYDYNKMIDDFKLWEASEKIKKEKQKKHKKVNLRWKERLSRMKINKRELIEEKRNRVLLASNKKDAVTSQILDKNKSLKESMNKEKMAKILEAEKNNKSKIHKHFEELEKKRLKEEKRSQEKLFRFTTNNIHHLNEIKEKYSEKINRSLQIFNTHLQQVELEKFQIEQVNAQNAFEKFKKFYFHLKEVKENQKLKREKHKEKMVNKKEILDKIEETNMLKGQAILTKLDQIEKKRFEIVENQTKRLRELREKEEENYKKKKHNKQLLQEEQEERNKYILEGQLGLIGRAKLKETSVNLNRLNAYENTILTQMELEKKLNSFYSKMNSVKDKSVFKKSKEQRKEIYLELKRQEEERKKKEEEERLKKLEMI